MILCLRLVLSRVVISALSLFLSLALCFVLSPSPKWSMMSCGESWLMSCLKSCLNSFMSLRKSGLKSLVKSCLGSCPKSLLKSRPMSSPMCCVTSFLKFRVNSCF